MRPPRSALVPAAAVVAAAAIAMAVTGGSASADGGGLGLPTVSGLPSVSVSPVPLPSVSLPSLPLPTSTSAVPVPSVSVPGSGGSGGSGSGSGSDPGPAGGTASTAPGTAGTVDGSVGPTPGRKAKARVAKRRADATPVLAGTPAARDLVDDESSPAMHRAGVAFLSADQGIAALDQQKREMARLKQSAAQTAQLYRAMGYDVAGAQRVAAGWHQRYNALPADTAAPQRLVVSDTATRADERLGDLIVAREGVQQDFDRIAARYDATKAALAGADQRIETLAADRSTALTAVEAARSSDLALEQERLAESGRLGTEIESLSRGLASRGDTVQGTGRFALPLPGSVITSPYGMRLHPILHYRKLHTGTDFAGGTSVIRAADDGRVIMTIASTAYGNFTVIDHGMRGGHHLTTAYAHQSQFLVHVGQVVHRGEPIGMVGQTGYATGPHLHFEVRLDGIVVDPMRFLG
jgi:murein DD-endopeptidase MepM/ murein hydrolase activator NlpD